MSAPRDEITGGDPLNIPREEPPRSHTHLTVDDICREQHIGPLQRSLLWLAKTDLYVLHVVPNNCRVQLISLGMMVLFTTALAFGSSVYAVMSTLLPPDETGSVSVIPWLIALVYASGILIIDREIVGAVSNRALGIRIIFAFFIAIAVSWPVKLKFFEGRVNVEINRMIDERNSHRYTEIEGHNGNIDTIRRQIAQLRQTGEPERQQQRAVVQSHIDSLLESIKVLNQEIDEERKRGGCGRICEGLMTKRDKREKELEAAEDRLASMAALQPLAADAKTELHQKQQDIERQEMEIDRIKKDIAHEHEISYDFLTKWEALDRISKTMPDYRIISGLIFAFFMLLEMVPLMLKWSLGKTEYHYYLEARSNLNSQKIISLANRYMSAMQRSEEGVMHTPAEITDMIAWLIEDESREHRAPMETRSLSNFIREAQARRAANAASANQNTNEPDRSAADQPPAADAPAPAPAYDATIDEDEPQR